ALPRSADESAQASERHPGDAGTAEEGSEVWIDLHPSDTERASRVRLDGEGLRHVDGGPEIRSREGGPPAQSVPYQPVEDGRRPFRSAAARADWPLQPSLRAAGQLTSVGPSPGKRGALGRPRGR